MPPKFVNVRRVMLQHKRATKSLFLNLLLWQKRQVLFLLKKFLRNTAGSSHCEQKRTVCAGKLSISWKWEAYTG